MKGHYLLLILLAVLFYSCNNSNNEQGQDTEENTSEAGDLVESPRHHEWVEVTYDGRTVHCWLVYPEVDGPAPVVLVIHENRGLNDWARGMADQLAEMGYIAIAPDLLSGFDEEHEKTSDFPDDDAARTALYELDPDQVTADLDAVFAYARNLQAATGQVVTAGFCWGGSQSFRYATNQPELSAAMVFYGTAPEEEAVFADIQAPVYGFYGGDDNRVNATIEQTEAYMKAVDKTYNYVIYQGAGHAFMRRGEDPEGGEANIKARTSAIARFKALMTGIQ